MGGVVFGFYWFSYRPTQIKKECDYVTKTKPAIPYRAAMTKDQMQKDGMIEDCDMSKNPFITAFDPNNNLSDTFKENRKQVFLHSCVVDNNKRIAKYTKEQKAEPAKQYLAPATTEEYKTCLRANGI